MASALQHLSLEHLEILRNITAAAEANTSMIESPEAVVALRVAMTDVLEREATLAGFKSFAAVGKSPKGAWTRIQLEPECQVSEDDTQVKFSCLRLNATTLRTIQRNDLS